MPQEYQHDAPNPSALSLHGLMLYILPAPLFIKLLLSLLTFSVFKLLLCGGALCFFYSAAHLNRSSLARLAENRALRKPTRPKDSRGLAMIFIGLGMLLLMLLIRRPIVVMVGMSACAMVGYYLVYGAKEEPAETPVDFDAMPKATREAITGAYQDIEDIEKLVEQLCERDQSIAHNAGQVVAQSYRILELVSKSPADASRARRFLNVYTNRIKEILEQYIALDKYDKGESYRQRLSDALAEATKAFAEHEEKLLNDDQMRLDVQLEVFDEQMKNEQK